MLKQTLDLDTGAVTLGLSTGEVIGPISDTHSVLGLVGGSGPSSFGYDPPRNQLAVGQRASNRVVLHRTGIATSIGMCTTGIPATVNSVTAGRCVCARTGAAGARMAPTRVTASARLMGSSPAAGR